jgi:hypothetical protein
MKPDELAKFPVSAQQEAVWLERQAGLLELLNRPGFELPSEARHTSRSFLKMHKAECNCEVVKRFLTCEGGCVAASSAVADPRQVRAPCFAWRAQ